MYSQVEIIRNAGFGDIVTCFALNWITLRITNAAVVSCEACSTQAATRFKHRLLAAAIETRDVSACVYNNTVPATACMNVGMQLHAVYKPIIVHVAS